MLLFFCLNLQDELLMAGRLHILVAYMPLTLQFIRTVCFTKQCA